MILQGRVKNLVGNFNTINGSIENNLKESQNIYKSFLEIGAYPVLNFRKENDPEDKTPE